MYSHLSYDLLRKTLFSESLRAALVSEKFWNWFTGNVMSGLVLAGLIAVGSWVWGMRTDMSSLTTDVAVIKTEIGNLKSRVDGNSKAIARLNSRYGRYSTSRQFAGAIIVPKQGADVWSAMTYEGMTKKAIAFWYINPIEAKKTLYSWEGTGTFKHVVTGVGGVVRSYDNTMVSFMELEEEASRVSIDKYVPNVVDGPHSLVFYQGAKQIEEDLEAAGWKSIYVDDFDAKINNWQELVGHISVK